MAKGWGGTTGSRFHAACKGRALFSVDADPAHRCMLVPDWHCNRASVKTFLQMTHSTLRTWTSAEGSHCPPTSSFFLWRLFGIVYSFA